MFDNENAHRDFEFQREQEKTDIPEFMDISTALDNLSKAADKLIASTKKIQEYASRRK